MFQEEYRKAYDKICVDQTRLQELLIRTEQRSFGSGQKLFYLIRPIAVPVLSLCFFCMMTLPALAKQIPAVYQVLQQYAPALTEYISIFCKLYAKYYQNIPNISIFLRKYLFFNPYQPYGKRK